jgi:thiamine-phosphate pyrophosphorylase
MISKLQYITQDMPGKTHSQLAEEACAGGIDWVQLRLKNKTDEEIKKIAIETQNVCIKNNARLIINDNVALAKEIGADGVHLGKQDMHPVQARKILGDSFIIGGTANTFEDIKMLAEAGVDYIGLGPFRFTSTKEKLSPIVGIEGYKTIIAQCEAENIRIPVIAIGGINAGDVSEILETGIYGVAVASVISFSENKSQTIKDFKEILESKIKLIVQNEK